MLNFDDEVNIFSAHSDNTKKLIRAKTKIASFVVEIRIVIQETMNPFEMS